jgi:putative membrane-bound dehydrogenase-like protein
MKLRKLTKNTFTCSFFLISIWGCNSENDRQSSPFSPEESLEQLVIADGFEIELVASEPLIRDPVDMAFDANGQLYVVEMPIYPSRRAGSPPSNIVLLTDTDDDGVYDKRTIFAEDLPFVNGVMPWKDGILVTNAPDIIYFADTDGDGKADVREVVLSGFATTNPQLRVSHLRYGMDNWIYGAYFRAGGSGGDEQFAGTGEPLYFPDDPKGTRYNISSGMDFRFRPGDFVAEKSGGHSQFGNTFDEEGNRFTLMNADHIRHIVIPDRYSSANPYYSLGSVMESISDHGKASRLYSITENMLNFRMTEHEVGHVTSACGIVHYTGGAFPSGYENASFFCDPARNVVHVDAVTRKGATFNAGLILNEKEFLASPDSWFRPVGAKIGPDGALYIVDMYRKLVEHPAYIPHSGVIAEDGSWITQVGRITENDFYEGQELGRIYRITPKGYKNDSYTAPKLGKSSNEELVKQLENPNMWWRINAQRLLVERNDVSIVETLTEVAISSESPYGRMHALWALQGMEQLDAKTILTALGDISPLVRKQAVVLTEFYLSNPEIRKKLVTLAEDADVHVQFQLVLTLSRFPDNERFEPLSTLARQHLEDNWFQSGIALSIVNNPLSWLETISEIKPDEESWIIGKGTFIQTIASIIGSRQKRDEISGLLSMLRKNAESDSLCTIAGLRGLSSGLQQGSLPYSLSSAAESELLKIINSDVFGVHTTAMELSSLVKLNSSSALQALINDARKLAVDGNQPLESRVRSISILGLNPDGVDVKQFSQLLSLQQPNSIQKEAARVLIRDGRPSSVQLLLEKWNSYTPDIRKIVESGFLQRNELALALLTAIEKGELDPALINQGSKSTLRQNPDSKIRELAENVFKDLSANDRKEVVAKYYESTTLEGDIAKGKVIFTQLCSECHQLDGVGFNVGPDLHSFSSRPKLEFLRAIVDPNFEISPGYDGNIVETNDGQFIVGTIINENTENIVLRMIGGTEPTVSRSNINSIRPMVMSLMPVGLEGSLDIQEMADLLTYLKSFD